MTSLQALVLGLLQGVTEFLPVSSSGHLVLAETWFGLEVQELLSFDVVVHAGTLVALVIYFWRDLASLFAGNKRLLWLLGVATLPIVLIGPFLKDVLEQYFRTADSAVFMLGVTALLLATAEVLGKRTKGEMSSVKVALGMGLFQVLAVIPGISRSGSTMVGGLLGGLKREVAARFAFLMAIPAIAGATLFIAKDLLEEGTAAGVSIEALAVGFVSSALASFVCMWGMLKYLRKRSLWVFVLYLTLLIAGYYLF